MELRHLRYFLMVAEELNFSKAAERLFISQPPLSRQIKELEVELKARLFNRNNKRVELTDAGKYFQDEAKKILQNLDQATLKTQKIANNVSGEFRIAYISSTLSSNISDLIQHLTKLYPFANFKLFEIGTNRQIIELEQGKLDLGILRAPVLSSKISTQRWFKDDYSLVYNKNLIQVKNDKAIESLQNATFVFFNKDYAPHYHDSLLQICSIYGFSPNVVHESNNINSIIQLVRNGLGVSIVPSRLAKNHLYEELKFMPLERIKLFTEVVLATPRGQESEIADAAKIYLMNKGYD